MEDQVNTQESVSSQMEIPRSSIVTEIHPSDVKIIDSSSKRYNPYYSSKKTPSVRWSDKETKDFYHALYQVGADFDTMEGLIPNRNRRQLYLKFKSEERKNPKIVDCLLSRKSSLETILNMID